jgi:alpha-tubulin suppressor-like RCC1 family protein
MRLIFLIKSKFLYNFHKIKDSLPDSYLHALENVNHFIENENSFSENFCEGLDSLWIGLQSTLSFPLGWGLDGTSGRLSTPSGLQGFLDIKCGIDHTVALLRDGTVKAWGSPETASVPIELTDVKQIGVGWNWAVALKGDGSLSAWGHDDSKQVSTLPHGTGFSKVSAGNMHGAGIRHGKVVCWGRKDLGQCNIPASVSNASHAVDVVASNHTTAALMADGTVNVWGADVSQISTSLTNVKSIALDPSSGANLVALKTDGTVIATGRDTGIRNVPVGLSNVARVYMIGNSAVAVKKDGSVVSWGETSAGNLGHLPALPTGFTWATISGRQDHAYGVVTVSGVDLNEDGFTD